MKRKAIDSDLIAIIATLTIGAIAIILAFKEF